MSSMGKMSDSRYLGGSRFGTGNFKNNYLVNDGKESRYDDALSTLKFMKTNAAKYNNFIRSGSSISPSRRPGDSPTRGPKSTITTRSFAGS
jgi:hypothetical protein